MHALSYDDILLRPQFSTVGTRNDVYLGVELPKGVRVKSPIMPANMKDCLGWQVIDRCLGVESLVLDHRFHDVETKEDYLAFEPMFEYGFGLSVGVKESDTGLVDKYVKEGCKIICVDVAHGDSRACQSMVEYIAEVHPHVLIIAGNVCTYEGAKMLYESGADVVKVGVGPGSVCTTRLMTGCGVPQVTALKQVSFARRQLETRNRPLAIIADGGIRYPGDAVKALCWADLVMCGKLFADTTEAVENNKGLYRGSSTLKPSRVEGTDMEVWGQRSVNELFTWMHEGIQSGCSYLDCYSVDNLKSIGENEAYSIVSPTESYNDRNKYVP